MQRHATQSTLLQTNFLALLMGSTCNIMLNNMPVLASVSEGTVLGHSLLGQAPGDSVVLAALRRASEY